MAVETGDNVHDFVVTYDGHGPVVRGLLTNSDGTPAAGVRVGLIDPDEAQAPPAYTFVRSDVTDASGYYQLDDCPQGDLEMAAAGHALAGGPVLALTVEGSVNADLELQGAAAGLTQGRFTIQVEPETTTLANMGESATLAVSSAWDILRPDLVQFSLYDADHDGGISGTEAMSAAGGAYYDLATVIGRLLMDFDERDFNENGLLNQFEAQPFTPSNGEFALLNPRGNDCNLTVDRLEALFLDGELERLVDVATALLDPNDIGLGGFDELDADGDGILSMGEAMTPGRPTVGDFSQIDVDQNGELTREELGFFRSTGGVGTLLAVADYLQAAFEDLDGIYGTLADEILDIAEARYPNPVAADDFVRFDAPPDFDGQVSGQELGFFIAVIENAGARGQVEGLSTNFAAADTDDSGDLTPAEANAEGVTAALFAVLDLGADALLTPDELQYFIGRSDYAVLLPVAEALSAKFSLLDADDNGNLSQEEVQAVRPTQAEFNQLNYLDPESGLTRGRVIPFLPDELGLLGGLYDIADDLLTRFEDLDDDVNGTISFLEATPARPTEDEFHRMDCGSPAAGGLTPEFLADLLFHADKPSLLLLRDEILFYFNTMDVSANGGLDIFEAQTQLPPTDSQFGQLDYDRDGYISVSSMNTVIEAIAAEDTAAIAALFTSSFEWFDTDGNGVLTFDEAQQYRPTENEFDEMDRDNTGELSLVDLQFFLSLAEEGADLTRIAEELFYNFNALDADSNGGLSLAEAQSFRNLQAVDFFSWRESPANPVLGLLPADADLRAGVTLDFPKPGTYRFSVRALRQGVFSDETGAVVFVPGLQGQVCISPSGGALPVANVAVRAYNDYQAASLWVETPSVRGSSYTDSRGFFSLDTLRTGRYWIAAQDIANNPYIIEYGELDYGPVGRVANGSKATGRMEINLRMETFTVAGNVYHGSADPENLLENVRVIVAPNVISESYTTTTDVAGKYRIEGVPAGPQNFMVVPDNLMTADGTDIALLETVTQKYDVYDDISLDFVLPQANPALGGQTATMKGFVMASVAGFQPVPLSYAEVIVGGGYARAYTDSNGQYEITGLPPGTYAGIVRKDGYEAQPLSFVDLVDITTRENVHNYVLTRETSEEGRAIHVHAPAVYGLVTLNNGRPVAGATITLLKPPYGPWVNSGAWGEVQGDVPDGSLPDVAAVSDQSGYYMLQGVPAGRRFFWVDVPGGSNGVLTLVVTGDTEVPIFPDMLAADADRDTLPDDVETAAGGNPNGTDSDGDGIYDGAESAQDADGDGLLNFVDPDSDGDGILDVDEGAEDLDGDWIPNFLDLDSDGDTLPDELEATTPGLDPYDDGGIQGGANGDFDEDGLTNIEEILSDPPTDLERYDSDGDGLSDYDEIFTYDTNPTFADDDGDGIADGWDSDGDGMPDGWEIANGLDPNSSEGDDGADGDPDEDGLTNIEEYTYRTEPAEGEGEGEAKEKLVVDSDGDSLTDDEETALGTDPADPDSDDDGMPDGWEVDNDLNPLSAEGDDGADGDPDEDGLTNIEEYRNGVGTTGTDPSSEDTDEDGLPDGWEVDNGFDPTDDGTIDPVNGAAGDPDEDGLTNLEEYADYETDPNDADTDGDNLDDGWEVESNLDPNDDGSIDPDNGAAGDPDEDGLINEREFELGTNANLDDTDGDGVFDGVEVGDQDEGEDDYPYLTDPLLADTDQDGMDDGWEAGNGLDPSSADGEDGADGDADNDGLDNVGEFDAGTDPNDPDSDGDGMPDGWEDENGLDPASSAGDDGADGDPDEDEFSNLDEFNASTEANNPDSDNDLMEDGWEASNGLDPADNTGDNGGAGDLDEDDLANADEFDAQTDPNDEDSDDDGLPDGWEVDNGLNPMGTGGNNGADGDKDDDGLSNIEEYEAGTDPDNDDTDGDELPDGWEVDNGLNPAGTGGNNGADGDQDDDGLSNKREYKLGTDADDADTDNDGIEDGVEASASSVTDPLDADTDDDGLPDGWEVDHGLEPDNDGTDDVGGTNGRTGDPDGDGRTNIQEYRYRFDDASVEGTDPREADTDADGLRDGAEINRETDATNADTDGDGMPDGWELDNGIDPLDDGSTDVVNGASGDVDEDGLLNLPEYIAGSQANNEDSDDDGLPDFWEIGFGLDPADDGSDDADNGAGGDPDNDDLTNAEEFDAGTDPTLEDSDADGLPDAWEVGNGLDPLDDGSADVLNGPAGDVDEDGLTNAEELENGTRPQLEDTDSDGVSDGAEIQNGTDPLDETSLVRIEANPESLAHNYEAGQDSVTLTVSRNTDAQGDLSVNWTARVTRGGDFLSLDAEGAASISGTADNSGSALDVFFAENESLQQRTGSIRIEGSGLPALDIAVTQAGNNRPVVAANPDTITLGADGLSTSFTVLNNGGGSLAWEAAITQGGNFLEISSASSGDVAGRKVWLLYSDNTSGRNRTGEITVSEQGNASNSATVTITQSGCDTPDAPTNVTVAEGTVASETILSWDAVRGADGYDVYRAYEDDSEAAELMGTVTETTYTDQEATAPEAGAAAALVAGCTKQQQGDTFQLFYWVKATNACGESDLSENDSVVKEPAKSAALGHVYEQALPAAAALDLLRTAAPDGTLAVRLRSTEDIDPATVWGTCSAGGTLGWLPVVEGAMDDLWAVCEPEGAWPLGSEVTLTAGALTASGAQVGPVTAVFYVEDALESGDSVVQPAQSGIDTEALGLGGEDSSLAQVSVADASGLPELAGAVGPAYAIVPRAAFATPQRVWLPLPEDTRPEDVVLYYYFADAERGGWYAAGRVEGFAVPDSYLAFEAGGISYLGVTVRHGGLVRMAGHSAPASLASAGPGNAGLYANVFLGLLVAASLLLARRSFARQR